MEYRVTVADSAKEDANTIYQWVVQRTPLRGPGWFDELMASLNSLRSQPHRCPLAREARRAHRDVRCLVFGRRRYAYRVLFEIHEKSNTVRILHIRRGARADIKPASLS